jgi:protein involved in polysaccharide export with SLBB domain
METGGRTVQTMKNRGMQKMVNKIQVPVAILWLTMSASLYAQLPSLNVPLSPNSPASANSSSSSNVQDEDAVRAESESQERPLIMPASQLIRVLRNKPEIMVEVKSLVADAAQQNGLSLQADSLTDQQVYSQLEKNKDLRESVTHFLLARGYISEQDIEAPQYESQYETQYETEKRRRTDSANSSERDLEAIDSTSREAMQSVASDENDGMPTIAGQTQITRRHPAARVSRSNPPHESNVTDEPDPLRRPAPYNLLSLRDLYTQAPDSYDQLKRFGSDLYLDHGELLGSSASGNGKLGNALDVPLGPDYILGPGDELSISLWGGVSMNLLRVVDRGGRIVLPEAGPMEVAGLSMEKVQELITNNLHEQYRNVHVALTVSAIHSFRIYVVGDVQRPGSYQVSALASPMSALLAAGGPTAGGSLRVIRHYRNEKPIGEIDLYDFMLRGVRPNDERLQAGDTLLVPPVGPQIAIFGAVKRPAIYEMRDEKDLSSALDVAGGLTVAAALTGITIDRVVANRNREQVALNLDASEGMAAADARLRSVEIKDGDRVRVGTVLPHSERVIYVQGHVARPGKFAFRENMQISDVLHSYGDLLPEPAEHGEIVRLVAPDLHPETIEFNLADVLIGNSPIPLEPFDTIKVFGRYEQDAPTVSIRGEVQRPGAYPLFKGMTAAQLVRTAGGFKRDALTERADLASYEVANGNKVSMERRDIAIGDAVLKRSPDADATLKPGDVLTIHQITGWNDIGASIVIEGEVAHPGSYGFQEGEHLSDILRRAGGFRTTAYPEGAVLTRPDVATLEAKSREELIRQIEASSAAAHLSPSAAGGEQGAALQMVQQQQNEILERLRRQPPNGRLVVHISSSIDSWAGTEADVEVRSGDVLRVPKRPGFVLVSGQAYSPSAITYMQGKSAEWYLSHAGGSTAIANRKEIFIIRANGDVIGRRSGNWFEGDVLSTKMNPGDTIVVPQKISGPSMVWRNLLITAQIATSLAITASVAGL